MGNELLDVGLVLTSYGIGLLLDYSKHLCVIICPIKMCPVPGQQEHSTNIPSLCYIIYIQGQQQSGGTGGGGEKKDDKVTIKLDPYLFNRYCNN